MEEGLAASMVNAEITVEQVVRMLQEGADPQELVDNGVPVALVEQAMQVLMQQTQPMPEEQGLAGMATQNTMVGA